MGWEVGLGGGGGGKAREGGGITAQAHVCLIHTAPEAPKIQLSSFLIKH